MSYMHRAQSKNLSNLLLIFGNGRNVGKTYFACELISQLSKQVPVIGLKISPHFHLQENPKLLLDKKDLIIIEENQINEKDSSLMLKAGASKVYFIMASQEKIGEAIEFLREKLQGALVVCESGGLGQHFQPGLSFFIKHKGDEIQKDIPPGVDPIILERGRDDLQSLASRIEFSNKKLRVKMDQFHTIQNQIKDLPIVFSTERIPLSDAFGRVLRESVIADTNMPPFDKSAMDGYACRREDLGSPMEVLEIISAGMVPTVAIGPHQCSKIMTGAKVPEGADCVFMVEHAESDPSGKVTFIKDKSNTNICYAGEDYMSGDKLLEEGVIIQEAHMAILASAGYASVNVSKIPKVAVIATGSELVSPGDKPQMGQIRNSNSSQLMAQIRKMGLKATDYGIVKDDFEVLSSTFDDALVEHDVVIFTGGASVGDFDWVPKVIDEKGFEVYWHRTGIKPGNPMTFSRKGNKFCFGLAGNPVSALIQFDIFIQSVLYKLMGADYSPKRIKTSLNFTYSRKKADRLGIIPVCINDQGTIDRIPFNGSAHINAMAIANALMEVPLNQFSIKKGEHVYVRPV